MIRSVVALSMMMLAGSPSGVWGQEYLAREQADREAAEERYRQLSSAVEGLLGAYARQNERIERVAQSVQQLQVMVDDGPDLSPYITRVEFNKLVESVREIDRKREQDKQEILNELDRLGRSLRDALKEAARQPTPRSEPKPTAPTQGGEGVWHTIERGNTVSSIAAAYNDAFRAEGRSTSVQRILDANPGVKPTSLQVGTKIFIPLVSSRE